MLQTFLWLRLSLDGLQICTGKGSGLIFHLFTDGYGRVGWGSGSLEQSLCNSTYIHMYICIYVYMYISHDSPDFTPPATQKRKVADRFLASRVEFSA